MCPVETTSPSEAFNAYGNAQLPMKKHTHIYAAYRLSLDDNRTHWSATGLLSHYDINPSTDGSFDSLLELADNKADYRIFLDSICETVSPVSCVIILNKNDDFSELLHTAFPIIHDDGRVSAIEGTIQSLNTNHRNELKWDVINQVQDAVITLNSNRVIVDWNKGASRLFRFDVEEVLGKHLDVLYSPDSAEMTDSLLFNDHIKSGLVSFNFELADKDSNRLICSLSLSILRDANGNLSGYVVIARDMSDLNNVNSALQLRSQQLEDVQEMTKLGYWESDITKDKLWISSQMYEIYELETDKEPHYRTLLDSVHPDDKHIVRSAVQQCMRDGAIGAHEYRIITGKGNIRYVQGHAVVKYDENNRPVAMAGTGQDVTASKKVEIELDKHRNHLEEMVEERTLELERLDSKLLEVSRRAGMFEVASSVLHNVGNVLNSINISVAMANDSVKKLEKESLLRVLHLLKEGNQELLAYLSEKEKGRQLLEYLNRLGMEHEISLKQLKDELASLTTNIDHVKYIVSLQQSHARVKEIKEQVKPEDPVKQALQISGLYSATGDIMGDITVHFDCHAQGKVSIETHNVLQILVNLVTNAKEALVDSNQPHKEIRLTIRLERNNLIISVADNGPGIPESKLAGLFNAGYSSKESGRGYGLHSSAILVQQMGGSIEAISDGPGKGSEVILRIPV